MIFTIYCGNCNKHKKTDAFSLGAVGSRKRLVCNVCKAAIDKHLSKTDKERSKPHRDATRKLKSNLESYIKSVKGDE